MHTMRLVYLKNSAFSATRPPFWALCSFLFMLHTWSLSAQTRDLEEMWKQQQVGYKPGYAKPMYLELKEDEILKLNDRQPNFGIFKNNYFTSGIPVNKPVTNKNFDAKFQISIRQRLLNKIMPHYTQLMLIYTQKSFWDIASESRPFTDNNYNPGLVASTPLILENKLKGMVSVSAEHESNGRDGDESRSWNYITLSGIYFHNIYFSVQSKLWYGLVDKEGNSDLFKYRGYGLLALNYRSFSDRLGATLVVNPGSASVNTQLEVSFKTSKNLNQYLFLQWYQGYGENLLEYNRYTSMVRIGICLKPPLWDIF